MNRRELLRGAVAFLAAWSAAPVARAAGRPRFVAEPFSLGVASGWPLPDGFSAWTRLAPIPLVPDGGMTPENVDVTLEVAEDEAFARVVHTSRTRAVPELAHAVHVDVKGLAPDRWYHFRFRAGDAMSPVGRSRTAPALGAAVSRLRFAIGSCQHFEQGWFTAHRHLADEDLDLMLFLGDYLYESSWGDDLVRRYVGGETTTLGDYRVRHAQHRTDPDLQRLHGLVPWLVTWDDHEIDNDWAADQSEHLDPAFVARRAAASQAFWEHMPLPVSRAPRAGELPLFGSLAFGRLARFVVLDDRQYRTPQACPDPAKGGGSNTLALGACPAVDDEARTMLGAAQERWLDDTLAASREQWTLLAQQTLVADLDWTAGPERTLWTDHWQGYPAARRRLLASLQRRKVQNPLFLGGDHHSTYVTSLRADPRDERSPIVASEVVGTSITSAGSDAATSERLLAENPHLLYANGWQRGYVAFEVTPEACRIDVRAVETKQRDGGVSTAASFVVEAGRPGPARA